MRCRMIASRLLMFALFALLASAAKALPPPGGGSACDANPCQNDSFCTNGPDDTYTCTCTPGWTGTNCDVNIDECESSPCVNGVCIDQVDGYRCSCLPGWTHVNCQIDIDECASDPCVHGDCNDQVNGYSCSCHPEWNGVNCDTPVATLDCSDAVASPGQLWPPNHQLVAIQVLDVTDPNNGLVTVTFTSVFQDEPVGGTGSGDTSPDAFGVGTSNLTVRSERAGNGNGRVYHIGFSATSTGGGSCTGNVTVGVPKSQGKNGGPVDGGALYNSTQP